MEENIRGKFHMDELFDVYNEEKIPTGRTRIRKKYFLKEGEYMLIVLGLIETPDHRFLITRRAFDKKWAAGDWEIPGGGVRAGETSSDAVLREIREETGLILNSDQGKRIYTYKNVDLDRGDNYFTDIYHFHADLKQEDIHLQKEETIDFRIASVPEIRKIAAEGHFLHDKRIQEALRAEGLEIL